MNVIEIMQDFSEHDTCIRHLEKMRWGDIAVCPYCGSERNSPRAKENRHICNGCNSSFSVLVGTIFQASKLPLPKWFTAICLITNAKKGISSLQLSRDLGVNKDTAWYVQKRIRQAMDEGDSMLTGIVEVDETYVGGSLTNMSQKNKDEKGFHRTGMEHKTPVLGMIERQGRIMVRVIEKAWGDEIRPLITGLIKKDSVLVTDGFGAYHALGEHFKEHIILNHSKKLRRIGDYHTNTIEGFWSMFKRAIVGQFHKISPLHLQDYLNELSFKYNNRNSDGFNILMNRCLQTNLPLNGQ